MVIVRTRTLRRIVALAVSVVALGLLAPVSAALAAAKLQNPTAPGAAATSTAPAAGTVNRASTPTNPLGPRTAAPRAPLGGTGASATGLPTTGAPAPGTRTVPPTSTPITPVGPTATSPGVPAGSPLSSGSAAHAGTGTPAKKKSGGRRISTGVAIIAALAALLALGATAWALARRFAYEPAWWLGMRHSFAEASFRTSATWSELRDWARIGR